MASAYCRISIVFCTLLVFSGMVMCLGGSLAAQITISEPKTVETLGREQANLESRYRNAPGIDRESPRASDPIWSRADRPSLLTDRDCGEPPTSEITNDRFELPQVTHQGHSDLGSSRVGTTRTKIPAGSLHQAYGQSYRNQLPTLKEMHPADPWKQTHAVSEPDLFGNRGGQETGCPTSGARGQWFGRYEALIAWPYYSNGHQGLTLQAGPLSIAEPFDYDLMIGNRFVVGWESKKGPGGMFQFTDLFAISEQLTVGAVGGISGLEGQVNMPSLAPPFSISALSGERLDSTAREHLTSYRPTAFKRVYFPISTITGGFGFDHTVLRQSVRYTRFANLATTAPNETLEGHRRFSGIGPSFDIEYHRPIGHTPLAMIGGAQMGVVFGSDRWSVLENGVLAYQQSSHRVLTNANVRIGVEWSQAVGSRPDSRVFARFTVEGQNWLNAGNFSSSESSLGFLSGNFAIGAAY